MAICPLRHSTVIAKLIRTVFPLVPQKPKGKPPRRLQFGTAHAFYVDATT